jgi:hypothetical protein
MDEAGQWHVFLAWDSPPPLKKQDHHYYLSHIIPKLLEAVLRMSSTMTH